MLKEYKWMLKKQSASPHQTPLSFFGWSRSSAYVWTSLHSQRLCKKKRASSVYYFAVRHPTCNTCIYFMSQTHLYSQSTEWRSWLGPREQHPCHACMPQSSHQQQTRGRRNITITSYNMIYPNNNRSDHHCMYITQQQEKDETKLQNNKESLHHH